MQLILILLFAVNVVYTKLTCTKCPFHITPKGHTKCTETCEGDVCIIVVNQHFNGTIIAGCINLHEGDTFKEGPAACYRQQYRTSCACTTKDQCNNPTSPIADFKFVEKPILEGYQFTPLIGGPTPQTPTILINGKLDDTQLSVDDGKENNETPNGTAVDDISTVTPQTIEVAVTRTSPFDVIVTKTVALQIGDGGNSSQQPSQRADTNGTDHKTKSGFIASTFPLVMITSLAVIASLMIF